MVEIVIRILDAGWCADRLELGGVEALRLPAVLAKVCVPPCALTVVI